MATRPSRRAATRRTAVIDSDDEEVANTTQKIQDESEDDFAPETSSPRRRAPRKSTAAPAPTTPKRVRGRPKKSIAPASIEPSEVFDPDQTAATVIEPESPEKPSPRKRKSTAPRVNKSATPELQAPMPTPKPSTSPEPSQLHGTPLADITAVTVNVQPADQTQMTIKPIRPMDTILEKPMDIVLKSRTTVLPVVEDTGPRARIVITYLILTNFKSYAGRQEVGPFHASFSSVVGPNGSGKSNVIDSLLFVFGFRASKMRQGKISALIHNSAQYPDLDFCEVAVHFQEVMDQVRESPFQDEPSD
jgi:structural maintenance of chromosome 4